MSEFSDLPDFTHEAHNEAQLLTIYDKAVIALTMTEQLYPKIHTPNPSCPLSVENNAFRLFCKGSVLVENIPEAARSLNVFAEDSIALVHRVDITNSDDSYIPYVAIVQYASGNFENLSLAWIINNDRQQMSASVVSSDRSLQDGADVPMLASEIDAVEQVIDFLVQDI